LVSSSSSADVVHTVLIVCSFLLVVSLSPKPYITGVGGTAASYESGLHRQHGLSLPISHFALRDHLGLVQVPCF